MSKSLTIEQIRREVRKMDPALSEGDSVFHSAVLMLAACQVGTSKRALCRFTRLSPEFVGSRTQRLRESGVFRRNGTIAANWFADGDAMEFWLDACVAEGLMQRVSS